MSGGWFVKLSKAVLLTQSLPNQTEAIKCGLQRNQKNLEINCLLLYVKKMLKYELRIIDFNVLGMY